MKLSFTHIALLTMTTNVAWAEAKRVEVYPLTQTYVDVRAGDTLSEIAAELLPHNPNLQVSLMQDIIEMNPGAIRDRDGHYLLSGKRLWLPNSMQEADRKVDASRYEVESFSWGNVKRRK